MRLLVATILSLALFGCEETYQVQTVAPPNVKPVAVEVPTDEKSEVGWYPALRLGPDKSLHIAYCDKSRGDVRYGHRNAAGVLTLESAAEEGAVGKYIALAVDDDNVAHILYHNQDTKYLMYTRKITTGGTDGEKPQTTWASERLIWGPEIGMGSRLLTHQGKLFALFYDSREQLRFATRQPLAEKSLKAEGAWKVEVIDQAGGSWSIWTDMVIHGDKLAASYPHWNFVDSELRLAERPLSGGEWKIRTIFPMKKFTPGWMSSLASGSGGLHVAFTTLRRERIIFGKVPQQGDMTDTPIVGYFLNRIRMAQGANGDFVFAAAETGKGRLGNSTLAVIKKSGDQWTRYTVDDRRPSGSQLDIAAGPKGEAIILYHATSNRGLWLYDETMATTVKGSRPSGPEVATSQPSSSSQPKGQANSAPAK